MHCTTDQHVLKKRVVRVTCTMTLMLAGCSSVRPPAPAIIDGVVQPAPRAVNQALPVLPPAGSGRGAYYQDDGPGETPPADLQSVPDANPRVEPYSTRGNKPYSVFGKTYTPITGNLPLKQRGMGSWYGKKFHGQKTASGERYDMYKMTAAHPTLPIPSYARVTNIKTGAQVIVRVNDRGPFHSSRIIDLSYTAALKLGYISRGSIELEVERLLPDEIARINSTRNTTGAAAPVSAVALVQPPVAPMAQAVPIMPTAPVVPVVPMEQATALPAANVPATLSLDDFLKAQEAPSTGLAAEMREPPLAQAPQLLQPLQPLQPMAVFAPAVPVLAPGAFYLQFGAYAQSANADALRQQLMQRWPLALPALEVQYSGTVYRLYSGPFGSRSAAVEAAALADNPLAKPLIVQR